MSRRGAAVRQFFATVGFLIAVLYLVAHCAGCGLLGSGEDNARRLAGAATVEQYRRALQECVAEGKDAGSMAVYAACADEADKHYGGGK